MQVHKKIMIALIGTALFWGCGKEDKKNNPQDAAKNSQDTVKETQDSAEDTQKIKFSKETKNHYEILQAHFFPVAEFPGLKEVLTKNEKDEQIGEWSAYKHGGVEKDITQSESESSRLDEDGELHTEFEKNYTKINYLYDENDKPVGAAKEFVVGNVKKYLLELKIESANDRPIKFHFKRTTYENADEQTQTETVDFIYGQENELLEITGAEYRIELKHAEKKIIAHQNKKLIFEVVSLTDISKLIRSISNPFSLASSESGDFFSDLESNNNAAPLELLKEVSYDGSILETKYDWSSGENKGEMSGVWKTEKISMQEDGTEVREDYKKGSVEIFKVDGRWYNKHSESHDLFTSDWKFYQVSDREYKIFFEAFPVMIKSEFKFFKGDVGKPSQEFITTGTVEVDSLQRPSKFVQTTKELNHETGKTSESSSVSLLSFW